MSTSTATTTAPASARSSYFQFHEEKTTAKSTMPETSKVHERWPFVKGEMAPAQLYTTESGRLFHSGKIAIITVGLPARGKTLGVTTHAFHLGDYRRAHCAPGQDVPPDYFFVNASPTSVLLRQKILRQCRQDIYEFFEKHNGQVAIYDAVNPTAAGRRQLAKEFLKNDIHPIFIESACDDMKIIEENVRNVKINSPDVQIPPRSLSTKSPIKLTNQLQYAAWKSEDAVKDYLHRINVKIPHFETMEETELDYIKMINAGERIIVNNCRFGYLPNRVVFYLMNLHIKTRRTYFARSGVAIQDSYKADAPLSESGLDYSRRLADTVTKVRVEEHRAHVARGGSKEERPLVVWTSTRIRTVQTADQLAAKGIKVRQRQQLSQLNPGAVEGMTEDQIRELYPEELEKHHQDPYHHRYPRSESYHDLAVRLEPIILELEREHNDLLIIAHESVLRVLYAYLMACSTADIPAMKFGRDEIVEIVPASYNNIAKRIPIPPGIHADMPVTPFGFPPVFSGI
ncbi:6-phosphofructo-2-kinase [Dactylellina cionopaga]|nr:6-phosphofructo-2-kinase [Dactylellina cionopaga]